MVELTDDTSYGGGCAFSAEAWAVMHQLGPNIEVNSERRGGCAIGSLCKSSGSKALDEVLRVPEDDNGSTNVAAIRDSDRETTLKTEFF